jgi:hypothetical protein
MIYINEAHSNKWPVGYKDQPEPQMCMNDRVCNARKSKIDNPYELLIDQWTNDFEELFHAWPDKYYFVDAKTLKILAKSEYGNEGDEDGRIEVDCTTILQDIIDDKN